MSTWRNDASLALNVNGEHATYRLELWYRGDTPDHVTVASDDDSDEVTVHVDDLYQLAEALCEMAAEINQ